MAAEIVLEGRQLSKSFTEGKERQQVLDDVSFQVRRGECVGLVGRSGCGKSTLAKLIARLVPTESGSLLLDGEPYTFAQGQALQKLYSRLQVIFQMPRASFNPRQTLGWSMTEGLRNRGLSRQEARERAVRLLEEVGLSAEFLCRYPHEASGGECQRAAIARALALEPEILICDEATSALDATIQQEVVQLLQKLVHGQGIACLFITHDLALARQLCQRLLVMQAGRIVEEGPTEKVISAPASPYTRELLEAALW